MLDFLKFEIFNGRTAQEDRTVSLCQIWSKSVNPPPRYGDFSRWRPPPFWIFEIWNFWWSDGSRGPNCNAVPNLVEIGHTAAEIRLFLDFSKIAAIRRLGFVVCVYGPPTKGSWLYLSRAKFGWSRCSSLHNMHVFQFCKFGLKMPIHAPKIGVLGDFTP